MECDTYEYEEELYDAMRHQVRGNTYKIFPIPLLMEWERVRLLINPKAKKLDLLKYEKEFGGA